jgi:hypothetical protein
MLELKRLVESDHWLVHIAVVNGCDISLLTFSSIIGCGSDTKLLTGFPVNLLVDSYLGASWENGGV